MEPQRGRYHPVRSDVEGVQCLDRAISGYRVIDEVGSTATMDDRHLRRRRESESTKAYGDQDIHKSNDSRIDAMERDMSYLVRAMKDMRSGYQDSPDRRHRRHSERPVSRHDLDRDAYAQEFLARERMDMPRFEGKLIAGDIFGVDPIPKPYMFIKKLTGASIKKKFDSRSSMTASEYINAFTAMLADDRARDPSNLIHQLRHLHDVTTDAMDRSWPNVRQWSQFIFDKVETGDIAWSDYQTIQNERCRLSFMGSAPPDNTEPKQGNVHHSRETICLDYNSRSCQHGGKFKHHTDNGVRYNHSCIYCFASTGSKRDHAATDCHSKQKDRFGPQSGTSYQSVYQPPTYQHPNAGQAPVSRYRQYNQNAAPYGQQAVAQPTPHFPINTHQNNLPKNQ